jgi:hypothetical protein
MRLLPSTILSIGSSYLATDRNGVNMRIILTALSALLFLPTFASAQNSANPNNSKANYYDTFSHKWLDPAKWLINDPGCMRTLECVRDIQNGKLRLALRSFGANDSDLGDQWDWSTLLFANPTSINSITTEVTPRGFDGLLCSTNPGVLTRTQIEIGGVFFNTGSGDVWDDVADTVYLWTDASNPNTISVGNFLSGNGWSNGADMGSYPMGTKLTVHIAWDKANHQFVSSVTDENGPGKSVVVPYSVSDTAAARNPQRWIDAGVNTANCASAQTFGEVETFFDNVMINTMPRVAP